MESFSYESFYNPIYRTRNNRLPAKNPSCPSSVFTSLVTQRMNPHTHRPENTKSLSALKIQKVFRGFLVRKQMRKVMELKTQVNEIEQRILDKESCNLIPPEERLEVYKMLMVVMLRLGFIGGCDQFREDMTHKVIALLNRVEIYTDGSVEFVETTDAGSESETVESDSDSESDSESDYDWLMMEDSDDQSLRKQPNGVTVQTPKKAEELIENDSEEKMETNERLMNLVTELLKQNALQTQAMKTLAQQNALQTQATDSLVQTVGILEKAIRDLKVYQSQFI